MKTTYPPSFKNPAANALELKTLKARRNVIF